MNIFILQTLEINQSKEPVWGTTSALPIENLYVQQQTKATY